MKNVQEEGAEVAFKVMVKVPQVTAQMLVSALRSILHQLEKREPVGRQKMSRLMEGGKKLSAYELTSAQTQDVKQDMAKFDRLCRQYGVGYSAVKLSGAPGYQVFFRSGRADQMKAVIEEYMKYKFARAYRVPDHQIENARGEQRTVHQGEYKPDTAMVVSDKTRERKQDLIYTDYPKQRRQSVYDKLERAKQVSQQRSAERKELSMDKSRGHELPMAQRRSR